MPKKNINKSVASQVTISSHGFFKSCYQTLHVTVENIQQTLLEIEKSQIEIEKFFEKNTSSPKKSLTQGRKKNFSPRVKRC